MRLPKNVSQKWNMAVTSLLRFPFFLTPSSNIVLNRSKTLVVFCTIIDTAKSPPLSLAWRLLPLTFSSISDRCSVCLPE